MNTNFQLIKTEEELRKAVERLSTHPVIGLDTETTELDPYYGRLRLIQLATRYLNEAVDKSERLSNWDLELTEAQLEYAARDAAVLLPLREKLIERLKADSLIDCARLEFDCVMTVADMELTGFYMHKDRWL